MHAAVLHLAPILGAEKSKVPFYVAGGALVVWALVVSLGMGMRIPGFPRNAAAQRGVIAVTAVLVLAAVSAAVLTSGGSTPKAAASATGGAGPSAQAPVSEGTPTAPAAAHTKAPIATTGTPTPPSSPAAVAPLKLAANPEGQLSYEPKQLSAKAGKVTITMANSSPVEHNVTVAQGSTALGATPTFTGGSKTLTLNLKPGKYTFYCSVPGHRQAGMEGTLTIS
jgi:uncharacterized cupredoxin-like copper-binding protein